MNVGIPTLDEFFTPPFSRITRGDRTAINFNSRMEVVPRFFAEKNICDVEVFKFDSFFEDEEGFSS